VLVDNAVGDTVEPEGGSDVGELVDSGEGPEVGFAVGVLVGNAVGGTVRPQVGAGIGDLIGSDVGLVVGAAAPLGLMLCAFVGAEVG
jgi:hypothetical protein